MRRWTVGIMAAMLLAGGGAQAQRPRHHGREPVRTTAQEDHVRSYLHDVLGVGALAGVGAGATVDQVRTDPVEWGGGAAGFGRRLASHGGQLLVQESVHHGLAALMGRSTRYVRCACTEFGARASNAFQQTYLDADMEGRRAFSVPRVTGAFAGSFATMLWRPHVSVGSAAVGGATTLLFTFAGNVMKEYVRWP